MDPSIKCIDMVMTELLDMIKQCGNLVCVCTCTCVCVCACVYLCVCVHVFVYVHACVLVC